MLSLALAQNLFSLFLIMAMGYWLVKFGILKPTDSHMLSALVLYAVTPCLLIASFQIEATPDRIYGLLLALLSAAMLSFLAIGISHFAGRVFRLGPVEKASIAYPNCGNLVFPLTAAMFGNDWLFLVNAYCVIQNLLVWSHGRAVLLEERKFEFRPFLVNPCVISAVIGAALFFGGVKLPEIVYRPLKMNGDTIGPLSMLVTGILLASTPFGKLFRQRGMWTVILFRLLLVPIAAAALLRLSHLGNRLPDGNIILLISLLSACAPAANFVTQMAAIHRPDAAYANAIGIVSTLCAIISMPIIIAFYQYFPLA